MCASSMGSAGRAPCHVMPQLLVVVRSFADTALIYRPGTPSSRPSTCESWLAELNEIPAQHGPALSASVAHYRSRGSDWVASLIVFFLNYLSRVGFYYPSLLSFYLWCVLLTLQAPSDFLWYLIDTFLPVSSYSCY